MSPPVQFIVPVTVVIKSSAPPVKFRLLTITAPLPVAVAPASSKVGIVTGSLTVIVPPVQRLVPTMVITAPELNV